METIKDSSLTKRVIVFLLLSVLITFCGGYIIYSAVISFPSFVVDHELIINSVYAKKDVEVVFYRSFLVYTNGEYKDSIPYTIDRNSVFFTSDDNDFVLAFSSYDKCFIRSKFIFLDRVSYE